MRRVKLKHSDALFAVNAAQQFAEDLFPGLNEVDNTQNRLRIARNEVVILLLMDLYRMPAGQLAEYIYLCRTAIDRCVGKYRERTTYFERESIVAGYGRYLREELEGDSVHMRHNSLMENRNLT